MTAEIWKSVPSLPGVEVSSLGRVRVFGKTPSFGWWDKRRERFIFKDAEGTTFRVAPAVCEAFNGPAPDGKPFCLHDDENSRNNLPGNLKWGSHTENMNYPGYKAGRSTWMRERRAAKKAATAA